MRLMLSLKSVLPILLALAAAPVEAKCPHLAIAVTETSLTAPGGRAVPFTIIGPVKPGRYPLIAFSHGNFAAPSRYRAMLDPIAAAGYVIAAPMHVDSELMPRDKPPSMQFVWQSRNEDMALALAATPANADPRRRAAMGHSYGALNAQVAAGAVPANPPGRPAVLPQTLVAWSPPGPFPGLIEASGWASISTPSLTITGTSDIMPGFIDNWEQHRAAYDNTPRGKRWLWVGTGINHYFGGMFGREKAASLEDKRLFDRAIAATIAFLDTSFKRRRGCRVGEAIPGEMLDIDK
jgi:dienelactone hydrolase